MAEDVTRQPLPDAKEYEPTPQEREAATDVNTRYEAWRENRRPHEIQWFVNAAFIRGLQWVVWNDALQKLEVKDVPSHRMRITVNRILSKYRARLAKFLKDTKSPIIIPASTDREDKLDAEATQRALEYLLRKQDGIQKYREALAWTMTAGKGYWWFYWDPSAMARVKDPKTGKVKEVANGDAFIDVSGPFEVLVKDPGCTRLGSQPEIMRVKMVELEGLRKKYPKQTAGLKAENSVDELFQYEKQIAGLSAKGTTGLTPSTLGGTGKEERNPTHILRKELFIAPCAKYPKGRYIVVAGDRTLRVQDELPYGFWTNTSNPYPVVEFSDLEMAGQYWCPTVVEQMIGLQKEYNLIRSKVAEQIKLMAHPKVIVPAQCHWPKNAWTSEPGEVIRVVMPPGIPEPRIVHPANIAQDAWNAMNLIKGEFDDVSSVYPSMQGGAGAATSGFQTNLLQEAADSIHSPDIKAHNSAFEQACYKLRKMMAQGYDIPRLVSVVGRNNIPDVQEFSASQIDEHAEIIVYTGSALSSSPAVKTQQVIELWNAGIIGDTKNPETQRRALTMIDSSGLGELQAERRRDEEKARLENLRFGRGQFVNPALPFDDHEIHYTFHTDQMKSADFEAWDPMQQKELFAHALVHGKYINPQKAQEIAIELGMPPEFIQWLNPMPQAPAPGAPGAPPAQPGQPGPPPEGVPQQGPPPPAPGVPGPPMPPPGPPGPPMPMPGPGMPMDPSMMMPPSPGLPVGPEGLAMQPPPGIPPGMPPFAPSPLPGGGMMPPLEQTPPVIVAPERPKRKMTRIVRDPRTNLVIGAETVEQPMEDGEE